MYVTLCSKSWLGRGLCGTPARGWAAACGLAGWAGRGRGARQLPLDSSDEDEEVVEVTTIHDDDNEGDFLE